MPLKRDAWFVVEDPLNIIFRFVKGGQMPPGAINGAENERKSSSVEKSSHDWGRRRLIKPRGAAYLSH